MELLQILNHWNSPLGPFGDFEGRQREKEAWLSSLSLNNLSELSSVLRMTDTYLTSLGLVADDCYFEAAVALGRIGQKHPAIVLAELERTLSDTTSLVSVIEAVGEVGHHDGLPILTKLLADFRLSDVEVVALVCSLGEIGGHEARTLLIKIEKTAFSKQVTHELEVVRRKMDQDQCK